MLTQSHILGAYNSKSGLRGGGEGEVHTEGPLISSHGDTFPTAHVVVFVPIWERESTVDFDETPPGPSCRPSGIIRTLTGVEKKKTSACNTLYASLRVSRNNLRF